MDEPNLAQEPVKRYYVDEGRAHDHLLRCSECKSLVASSNLFEKGCCPKCGSRKVVEIVALSGWEWFKIRTGIINFDGRKEFIREFYWS